MKLQFKKIRWRNFLSTGNTWTELSLCNCPNTLIIGDNGSGKSTFLDALCFGLYGKSFRKIRKGQLVNSINQKNCEIEIEFSTNGKSYLVKRGIKPDIFEIWIDDLMLNQNSESKDYQAYLEKFVLGMNFKTFTQIVIAGSKSFTPFMQLVAADRRNFIEDLLDIQVFSQMSLVVKSRLTENKIDLEKNKIELDGKRNVMKMIDLTIFRLEEDNDDKIKENTTEISIRQLTLSGLEARYEALTKEIEILESKLVDEPKAKNLYNKMLTIQSKLYANKDIADATYKFFDQNCTCPTCHQDIDEDFKQEETGRLATKIGDLDDGLYKIENQIDDQKTKLAKFQELNNQLSRHRTSASYIYSDIQDVKKGIQLLEATNKGLVNKVGASHLADQIKAKEATQKEIDVLEAKHKELLDENVMIMTATDLLKDGGIKTKIIKQYIPVINKTINKYLSAMGFLVHFELDETFNETIKSRYRDAFSYESFSEGEKDRIDLALMLAWRAIAKTKNSASTNLLVLDEVFDGSMDTHGIDEMLKIMQGLTTDTDIFIISHKQDQMLDKFKKVYKATKKKNFSTIQEV